MDIQKSIVAILNTKRKIIGTGFVAGENLILTCAHVVETATSSVIDPTTELNVQVTIRFAVDGSEVVAQVDAQSYSPGYEKDIALLHVDALPQGVRPLPLAPSAGSAGHDFYAYGYATVTNVQGIGARGKIVDIVDNGRLVQLTSQEPDHGMSGGPVLDEQRRVVIGMVTKGKGLLEKDQNLRNTQTTFATSTQIIFEVCHELKPTEICPYRSLDAFTEEDAPFFFGRERVVTKLLESLKREPRFLAVLGPSGSGKSSVVRAGLLPALRQGKVPGSQKWGIVTIRPANNPFEQLASAGFMNPQTGLENAVKTWLADRPDTTRLMLVIDQFEEVLVSTPTNIRQKFIAELAQLLDAPVAITVVLTLRDDFYSRFLNDAAKLAGWLERGLVNAPPILEQDELKAIVFNPAKSVGLAFDEGLVDVIIADACETDRSKGLARSTILPLLEFALTQLWELRKDGRLTHKAYKNIGGTAGSLSQWADRIYYELSSNERKLAEQVFCRLVHLGNKKEQISDTRRTIQTKELTAGSEKDNIAQVVRKLIQVRLLSVHRDTKTGQQFVEIVHDALLCEWALLGKWIRDFRNREQKARQRRRQVIVAGIIFALGIITTLSLVAVIATILAVKQQSVAQSESQNATANGLAVQALNVMETEPDLALLLGIESYKVSPNFEAENALLATIDHSSYISAFANNGLDVKIMAISNDSTRFASSGCDRQKNCNLILWDIANMHPQKAFSLNETSPILDMKFTQDGKYLVFVDAQKIGLLDLSTFQIKKIKKLEEMIDFLPNAVSVSDDGQKIAYCSGFGDEKNIYVTKTFSGETKKIKPCFNNISFLSKTSILLNEVAPLQPPNTQGIARTNSVAFTNIDNGTEVFYSTKHISNIDKIVSARNREIFATGSCYSPGASGGCFVGQVFLYSAEATDKIIPQLDSQATQGPHPGFIRALAFSPDGEILASSGSDKTIKLWRVQSGSLMSFGLENKKEANSLLFTSDGKFLIVGFDDGKIYFINLNRGHVMGNKVFSQNYPLDYPPHTIYFDQKTDTMILPRRFGTGMIVDSVVTSYLTVFKVSKDSLVQQSELEKSLLPLDLNNNLLVTGDWFENHFRIDYWDIKTGQQLNFSPIKLSDNAVVAVLSKDNAQLATLIKNSDSSTMSSTLDIWSVKSGEKLFSKQFNSYITFKYIDNGLILLDEKETVPEFIQYSDPKLHILDKQLKLTTWDLHKIIPDSHDFWPAVFTSSTDGKLIAIGIVYGNTALIQIVDFEQKKLLYSWVIPYKPLNSSFLRIPMKLIFSSNNKILAGISGETIFLGDLVSGKFRETQISWSPPNYGLAVSEYSVLEIWHRHRYDSPDNNYFSPTDLAFTPDDKKLITSDLAGNILFWDLDPTAWVNIACNTANRNLTKAEWGRYFPSEAYRITCPQYQAGQ